MNNFPPKEVVEQLRLEFPKGTRVELIRMKDPYTKLKPGDKGTVTMVDSIGTIFVSWDRGGGLGVAYGEDLCRKISE